MRRGRVAGAPAAIAALVCATLAAAAADVRAQDSPDAGAAAEAVVPVEPGRAVTLTVLIHNVAEDLPLGGIEGRPTEVPPWVRGLRVEPDSAGHVPAGGSRRLLVRFDVAGDAPAGQRATLALELRADPGWTVYPRRVALVLEVGPGSGPPPAVGPPPPSVVPPAREPVAPPPPSTPGSVVLRLSEIQLAPNPWVPGDPNQYTLQHQAGAPGFVGRHLFGNGNGTDTVSVRLTAVPLEIVGGQPFEIAAEVRRRVSYREDHVCDGPARREPSLNAYLVAMAVPRHQVTTAGALTGAESTGPEDLRSYCAQPRTAERPYPRKPAFEVDGATALALRFEPVGAERAGARMRYRYRVRATSPGARALPTSELVIEGDPAQPDRFWQLLVMVGSGSPRGLHLVYRATGGPVIASLPPYDHPPDLLAPPRGGTVARPPPPPPGDGGASGRAGGAAGTGGAGGAGGRPPGPPPPERGPLDPDEARIAGLIRDWLAQAEPPENATDGARYRFDQWGDKVGQGAGVVATRSGPPDNVGGRSPTRFVWEERRGQDSVDHCTLEQYVTRGLAGQGIADCAARHQAVLKDLARATRRAGEDYARQLRLQAQFLAGAPAGHVDEEGTIERQEPAPGTRVPRGTVLRLYLHQPVRMPPLVGGSVGEARVLLAGLGLPAPRVVGAGSARVEGGAVIERQDPPVGAPVARAQAITVAVRAGEVSPPAAPPVVLPDVTNRPQGEARQAIAALGLPQPVLRSGAPTGDPAQAHTVERQEPPAGVVPRDRVVTLWVRPPVAPPAGPPPPRPPGSASTVVLPDLTNRPQGEARQVIAALGLPAPILRSGTPTGDPAQAHTVERQEPPAGAVPRDRVVTVWVRPPQAAASPPAAPPAGPGTGSSGPAPAEPRTWTTFDCRHPALAPPWDPPTPRAPVRADRSDPRVLHVECASVKRQPGFSAVSVWISWAEPGARTWGCGGRDRHGLGEPHATSPPAPGRYARSADTGVFSPRRRIRVLVRQLVYGQSPAALTADRFLPEPEARRLAFDYLARVEPHADACPGLAPPPATIAGTASGSSAVSGPGGPCQPARLVAEPVTGRGDGRDPYDRQTVRLHVDPLRTRWIAWNDQPAVVATSPSRPGQHLLGPGGFGVDDFIELTVTAPDGRSRTARLDANDAFGVSSGPQNVIFGRAGAAPAVLRRSPAGQERIFEEGGALTDLFALPGSYAFTFAFRDETRGRGPYAHGRIWLLVDAVECPVPRGAGTVAQVPSSGVAPPPGSPQALGLPVRLYLWESIHSNQPAYEHGGRYWFYSQEQWTGFLVQRGRDFERYQVQDPGRAMRRYTYQGTERRHDGKDEWHGLWQDLPAGASDRFRIVWP